jgi:hypothetical protein
VSPASEGRARDGVSGSAQDCSSAAAAGNAATSARSADAVRRRKPRDSGAARESTGAILDRQ